MFKKGVTVIELITVIVIIGILASGASLGIKEIFDLWQVITFRNEIVSHGRIALMRMAREMRQLIDDSDEEEEEIYSDWIRFTVMDLDGDDENDVVDFYYEPWTNTVWRAFNDNPPWGYVFVTNVSSFTLTYFDQNNEELVPPVTDISDIYRINITLTLSCGNQSVTLNSQVFPRYLSF